MEERQNLTPIKAIRAKCLDCTCNQPSEVKLCPSVDCPLYKYRLGKNPAKRRVALSEEQKNALSERLAAARSKKRLMQHREKNDIVAPI